YLVCDVTNFSDLYTLSLHDALPIISETIAWVEWVVSSKFARTFAEKKLTGAEFRPIFDLRNPTKESKEWSQLRVTGKAGVLAEKTELGRDPFSPSEVSWRCPLGHA